jgi:hypothetical protein
MIGAVRRKTRDPVPPRSAPWHDVDRGFESPNSPVYKSGAVRRDDLAFMTTHWRQDTSPHSCGDALFLFADGIGIDCRRCELGMPQPLLDKVEGNAGGDGRHTEAVSQPFG